MLLSLSVFMVLLLFVLAHWRARTIRLRLDHDPVALALGSWEVLDDLPMPEPVPAAG